MVREPPRINSEQGMYGNLPILYEDLDDGSDPIVLGMTLKPTHKQWNRNPIGNEPKNGRGRGELYEQLPNLCVLLHVGFPVIFYLKVLDALRGLKVGR